jgi:hypothetical protein
MSLALPMVLTAALLVARSLSASPRFFILGVPVAMLCVAVGLFEATDWVARRRGAAAATAHRWGTALVVLVALGSATALGSYYSQPKQAHRQVAEYLVEHRGPDELVGAVYTTVWGLRYYGPGLGLTEGRDFVLVDSMNALDRALETAGDNDLILLTTFPRAQRMRFPELSARIERDWSVVERFRGTVHDGAILVWRRRTP